MRGDLRALTLCAVCGWVQGVERRQPLASQRAERRQPLASQRAQLMATPSRSIEVTVPAGSGAGSELMIEVGGSQFMVTVPSGSREGDTFIASIGLPPDDEDEASIASVSEVAVIVPEGCAEGDPLLVEIDGSSFEVIIPPGCGPGMEVIVTVPKPQQQQPDTPFCAPTPSNDSKCDQSAPSECSGSSDTEGDERPTFPVGLPAEVMRSDGLWSLVRVVDYDAAADNYTVQLADGRFKYFVEPEWLRVPAFLLTTTAMI